MTGRVEIVGRLSGRRSRSDGETLEILAEAFQHAARAIIAAVVAEKPPAHLLIGGDALDQWRARLDSWRQEIDASETVTRGTDLLEARANIHASRSPGLISDEGSPDQWNTSSDYLRRNRAHRDTWLCRSCRVAMAKDMTCDFRRSLSR